MLNVQFEEASGRIIDCLSRVLFIKVKILLTRCRTIQLVRRRQRWNRTTLKTQAKEKWNFPFSFIHCCCCCCPLSPSKVSPHQTPHHVKSRKLKKFPFHFPFSIFFYKHFQYFIFQQTTTGSSHQFTQWRAQLTPPAWFSSPNRPTPLLSAFERFTNWILSTKWMLLLPPLASPSYHFSLSLPLSFLSRF